MSTSAQSDGLGVSFILSAMLSKVAEIGIVTYYNIIYTLCTVQESSKEIPFMKEMPDHPHSQYWTSIHLHDLTDYKQSLFWILIMLGDSQKKTLVTNKHDKHAKMH